MAAFATLLAVIMAGASTAKAAPLIKGQHYNDQKFLECGAAAECDVYFIVRASGVPRMRMSTFAGAGAVVSLDCSIAGLLKEV